MEMTASPRVPNRRIRQAGFTMIELMVSMAISLLLLSAVYTSFRAQQDSYMAQEQVVRMQQNLRAAMFYMTREIRMAGCNPTGAATPAPGFSVTRHNEVAFNMDVANDDGNLEPDASTDDENENISYQLDSPVMELERSTGKGFHTVAENIEAVDFVYLDGDGNVLNPNKSDITDVLKRRKIRSVIITMVARSGRPTRNYNNDQVYANQQGLSLIAGNGDAYQRRMLTSVVEVRNL